MIISVASGKGGTGKTTVSTNLASAMERTVQLLDCDVEEPNASLFLRPEITDTRTVTLAVPEIDGERCTLCGKCAQICQFKAITHLPNTMLTFPELCHSCGGCARVCPESAIAWGQRELGVLEKGHKNHIHFIHGKLRIGEAMSPPLIEAVRREADPEVLTIIDAPPGTSCPVITSMKNTDFILMVTEPTPFGLHDLTLAVEAVKLLGIPAGLVINRSDIGDDGVKNYAAREGLPVLMEIPFDRRIAEAYSRGMIFSREIPRWKDQFVNLYHRIMELAG